MCYNRGNERTGLTCPRIASGKSRKEQIMYLVQTTLTGLVPMMHDRFFNPEELEIPRKKSKDSWRKELPYKLWRDKKGVYVPVDNIRMMLIGNKHRPGAAKILGSYIETKKATDIQAFACSSLIGFLL